MDTFLGLLELIVWIGGVLALAASTTWLMVKIMPGKSADEDHQPDS
ncbi:MAG: hypothetical protein ACE5EV_00435 [Gaiellales bacterium]